mmetsp:Transcript_25963/g.39300  ORF Transcript_25963/g.39300 Transcript_25963/m.39300 type:complete len:561 (-) Transcript_25963:904-2586(-)
MFRSSKKKIPGDSQPQASTTCNGNTNNRGMLRFLETNFHGKLWLIIIIFIVITMLNSVFSTKTYLGHQRRNPLKTATFSNGNIRNSRRTQDSYDVVVAGAGPAGLTASLFAARAGLTVLVIGSSTGQLSEAGTLDNFPSWRGTGGIDWLVTTKEQAVEAGVDFALPGLMVESIQRSSALFSLNILNDKSSVNAKSVIVATGATGKRLNIPKEDLFWGKSIHSCAICDGSSYVRKNVVVVGGGDAAVDAAILLSRYADNITLIHRRNEFRASNKNNIRILRELSHVHLRTPYAVTSYEDKNQNFSGVSVKNLANGLTETISCAGVFIMIGSSPNTKLVENILQLDKNGLIKLKGATGTSVDGVFAAGEVSDNTYKQAITAAASGAAAAIDAERWLRQKQTSINDRRNPLSLGIPLEKTVAKQAKKLEPWEEARKARTEALTDGCLLKKQECIMEIVHKYPVVVFSKSFCKFCRKATEAFAIEGVVKEPYLRVININMLGHQQFMIQDTLRKLTGRYSVPNVYVGGESIGGGDETVALQRSGKLRSLLLKAKAIPGLSHSNE